MSTASKSTENNNPETVRNIQIVVFKIGNEEYGLDIEQIKEVVITPTITQMPQTPSYVKGVANIRGNVIAILDLGRKFGIPDASDFSSSKKSYTLVIESDEYKMGLLVKDVPNTLSITSDSIEETFFTGDQQSEQAYVKGIIKLNKSLIIMIDIFKVISIQDTRQLFSNSSIQMSES